MTPCEETLKGPYPLVVMPFSRNRFLVTSTSGSRFPRFLVLLTRSGDRFPHVRSDNGLGVH